MILGIIGEAGSGKSTAASFFKTHGAYIISADLIVRDIYQLAETKELILKKLGSKFINDDETINRVRLRKYAFKNYEFLKKIEAIIWPKMVKIIIDKVQQNQNQKLIVIDCAILFNVHLDYLVDKILLIEADENLKIGRIKERDNVSETEARALLNLQKNNLILNQKIDFTIKNNGFTSDFLINLNALMENIVK